MAVPAELRSSLPSSIDPDSVRAAVRAPGSPGSLGGETWLLDLAGGLAVVSRSSIFDTLEPLTLARDDGGDENGRSVELRPGPELEIRPAAGEPFVVRPSALDLAAVEGLLAQVEGLATVELGAGPGEAGEGLEQPPAAPPPDFGSPERSAAKLVSNSALDRGDPSPRPAAPTTLTDLSVIEPSRTVEVAAALEAGDDERAVTVARLLVDEAGPRERGEWADFVELVERLRAGDPAGAYLWSRGGRRVPTAVHGALYGRLAAELERAAEPSLAWAAWGERADDSRSVAERERLEARLELDAPALQREVASRAREFFSPLAEAAPGERSAQRGLAQAYADLDELDRALSWSRRVTAADPFDFEARMLEAHVLALIVIGRDDHGEVIEALQKIADDFPDRPEPLVELADQLEFDDPVRAIACLHAALERGHDELVLLSLAELYESQRRYSEVIALLEPALAEPDGDYELEDELRDLLRRARQTFEVQGPSGALARPGEATPAPTASDSRTRFALLVVLFVLTALAMLLT